MNVTINKNQIHSVEIQGGFTGPYINLEISAEAAYALLKALEAKRDELHDMATNYYDCRDRAETHHKSVIVCPSYIGREEGQE